MAGRDAVQPARWRRPGPTTRQPAAVVAELRAAGEEFARLWGRHEVSRRRTAVKRFVHPVVGLLEPDCEAPLSHGGRTQLVLHTARPGTESHDRLQLLRAVGTQAMRPGTTPLGGTRGTAP
ncbi:hypothetical protein [Streptomyces sp. NPDC058299]|uniref:MmyB family transcriptional regulator n=1 Tax=unclassified Streptomyces TaxID=2593676 RepID=UPI0036DFC865